jgi:hypothetical protein
MNTFHLVLGLALGVCGAVSLAQADPAGTAAEDKAEDLGFSYFIGLGRQRMDYRETASLVPVKTQVTTVSPLLMTGALYAASHDVLFSLDNQFTFYPRRATETWTTTGAHVVGNVAVAASRVLQTNGFSLSQSETQALLHYRLQGHWFALAGPSLRTQTFKRFSFQPGPDNVTEVPSTTVVEESTSEVMGQLGVAYETGRVKDRTEHFGLRGLVGVPVWRRVTNTAFPQMEFNRNGGVDMSLEGRWSWSVWRGVHLGAWGKWGVSKRKRSTQSCGNLTCELPESRLINTSLGLELLWKL